MSRLDLLPPYLFTELDRAKREAAAAGRDVVDLGIGDPDRPTPPELLDVMAAEIRDPAWHRYPDNPGSGEFRRQAAEWFARRYAVEIDPRTQVLALIGSKEGIAHLPLALLEEGDEVLVPDPGYPVYNSATLLAGGRPAPLKLEHGRGFLPDPRDVEAAAGGRTRLMFLNYPNNPTGAAAGLEDFRALLDAAGGRFAVANDAAYADVVFGGEGTCSLLQAADPAADPVIEFHSLSKMFNMTGWRIGFAVGHPDLIAALGRVKQNIDSGVFTAVQAVACHALGEAGDELLADVMSVYPPRRDIIRSALDDAGIEYFDSGATFYVWARVPGGEGSVEFCSRVLRERDLVLTPGVGFGAGGEGWFRISLTAADDRIAAAAERIRRL